MIVLFDWFILLGKGEEFVMLCIVGLIMLMGLLGVCLNLENELIENLFEVYVYISFVVEMVMWCECVCCEVVGGEVCCDGMVGWE